MDKNGVWQLLRITFQYCPVGGSSRGMREFLRTANQEGVKYSMNTFAKLNQHLEIVAQPIANKHPKVIGEYRINEASRREFDPNNFKHLIKDDNYRPPHIVDVKNKDFEHIYKVAWELRNTTGRRLNIRLTKPVYSQRKSIQGLWEPGLTDKTSFKILSLGE